MAAFHMEQMRLRLQSRSSASTVPYPLDVPVQFPPQPALSASGVHEGGEAAEASDPGEDHTNASMRSPSMESHLDRGILGRSPGVPPGELPLENDAGSVRLEPLEAAAAAFRGEVQTPWGLGSAPSPAPFDLESEDNPLADLLDSESHWWEQVRDQSSASTSVPLPDPLAGRRIDFASVLRSAYQVPLATAEPEGFAQPWDEGVFGVIFGDKDFLDFPVAKLGPTFLPGEGSQPSEVVEMPSKRRKAVHEDVSYSRVVKSRAAVDWKQQRSAQLEIGLQTWLELVLKWGPCVLTSQTEACTNRCDQLEVIGDILKGKAPSTILKRARALVLLQDFLKERDCIELHTPCGRRI